MISFAAFIDFQVSGDAQEFFPDGGRSVLDKVNEADAT
jgi:hypothetical protein